MEAREERGLQIANTAKITKRDRGTWIVPSQSDVEQFNVARVLGDKAYSSYANLELTVSKGAEPFIPFKSYAVATSPSQTWNRLFAQFV